MTTPVTSTPTGHEHHSMSGPCVTEQHDRCRHRSRYDDRCVYVCPCLCHGGSAQTRCPRCGTDRCWLQWVAMTESDTDSWTCVFGHNWGEKRG